MSNQNDGAYILPRHPTEVDRLDIQHYAMRDALGANYLAPIERPARVLDVGCGTGQWAFELCEQFPDAQVVGLDLHPSKPEPPANYRFVRADLLKGLPFRDDCFGFVHQRLLQPGVPLERWTAVVSDLVRVTRLEGWIELVELKGEVEGGPATRRLLELLLQLAGARGLDGIGVLFRQLDDYLRGAGLAAVQRRDVDVPIGRWGGSIGSLMATDLRALYTRLADSFQASLGLPASECHELIAAMSRELGEYHTLSTYGIAIGQKPVGHETAFR